jgi:hypothetical protein
MGPRARLMVGKCARRHLLHTHHTRDLATFLAGAECQDSGRSHSCQAQEVRQGFENDTIGSFGLKAADTAIKSTDLGQHA